MLAGGLVAPQAALAAPSAPSAAASGPASPRGSVVDGPETGLDSEQATAREAARVRAPQVERAVGEPTAEPESQARSQATEDAAPADLEATTAAEDCTVFAGYPVCEPIRAVYLDWGGPDGDLGDPITEAVAYAGGLRQDFAGDGSIYWSQASGAHVVRGEVLNTYVAQGEATGALGWPTSDEVDIDAGSSAYQEFQPAGTGGPAAIFWNIDLGAFSLDAGTYAYYTGLGGVSSFLGFPLGSTYDVPGTTSTDFQGGQIAGDNHTGSYRALAGFGAMAGQPGANTQVKYQLSDTLTTAVDVGTGNLNLSMAGLSVPGIGGDRGIGITYNSFASAYTYQDQTSSMLGAGFRFTESPDVKLVPYADGSIRYVTASGQALLYRWNGTSYESPIGSGGTTLTRDGANNWVLTTLASNQKQVFRAADGLMLSDTDRNGVAYTFAYNSAGKPATITGTRGNGDPITFSYGGTGVPNGALRKMTQTVDGTARSVTFGYDAANNQLTSVTDASGHTTNFGWTDGLLTEITTPNGAVTTICFTTWPAVASLTRDSGTGGLNATTQFSYGGGNYQGKFLAQNVVTDPNGHDTTYAVDAFGKVLQSTDALGHTRATTYSPNDDIASAADSMPGANTTMYSYNGADGGFTPTGATAPTGASASASYPSSGTGPQRYLPSSTTDTQGNATTLSYDAAGNPTQQISGGVTTSTTYNPPAGQATTCTGGGKPGQPCTETDGKGQVTTYGYDTGGNMLKVTPPATGVIKATTYTYDGAGRPKTVTDGKGQVTHYVYDANDRVTQIRYGNASNCGTAANCEVYTYDDNGNLTSRKDGAGTTNYSYDQLNRLTGQTTPAGSGGGAQPSSLSYDLTGNTLTFTDALGTTGYGYDAANNLVSLAEPGGSCTGAVAKCTTYSYNANDVRTAITYPGGTTVQYLNIDASGRPLQYKATNTANTVLMDFTYSYTRAGADTGVVQTRTDATVPGTAVQAYSYDGLNRLTRALEKVGTNTTASWSYCYDANGNRTYDSTSIATTVLCPGQSGGPAATYTYDATDALTARAGTAFSYDANGAEITGSGATTRTAGAWNTRGQLTSLISGGTTTGFSYAGEGNKERLSAGGSGYQNTALGVTTQTGDGASSVIREPNGTAVALRMGTASYYYIPDRQGSTIALVDATGTKKNSYSYDPYGASRIKTETVANPWQYIGGQLDTTGVYHLQARYYDPSIGRFTQLDPSGQEQNPYLYTSGNPINATDPTGLFSWGSVAKAAVIGIGAGLVGGIVAGAVTAALIPAAVSYGTAVLVGGISGAAGTGTASALTSVGSQLIPG